MGAAVWRLSIDIVMYFSYCRYMYICVLTKGAYLRMMSLSNRGVTK